MKFLITIISIVALAGAGWFAWAVSTNVAPGQPKFVMLHPGYSTRHIANELKNAGVIRSSSAFVLWQRLHRGKSLKAGEYLFERPASTISVTNRLTRGDVYVHTVVIPEGFNMFDIAQAMQDAGLGSKEEFLKVAADGSLVSDLDPGAVSLEGYLFPDTYGFTKTQSMMDMTLEMVKKFKTVAREIGLNGNTRATVTLASIVEKETGVPAERPEVASVYRNRLDHNMPLQADPSIIYAELMKGSYSGALHHQDMQFASLYNTYLHAGLPPGPIANPGKSALQAAMQPASTNYFYFVADGSGGHKFAASLEDHNRNVAAYRKMSRLRQ